MSTRSSSRSTTRSTTKPMPPARQRKKVLDSERKANRSGPRNFREDALTDKVISVEPDGTGPTPTETFDPKQDHKGGDPIPDGRRAAKSSKT